MISSWYLPRAGHYAKSLLSYDVNHEDNMMKYIIIRIFHLKERGEVTQLVLSASKEWD